MGNTSIRCWARACMLAALAGTTAAAATDWSGAGGDNAWSTPGNWVGGAVPASDDHAALVFGPAAASFISFVDVPWRINRLDVLAGPFYNIGGNTISFGGVAPQVNLSGGVSINSPLEFLADVTLTHAGELFIASSLGGPGGLAKVGPDRLTITSPTMYAGTTTVASGILRFGNQSSGPSIIPGPIVTHGVVELSNPVSLLAQGVSGPGRLDTRNFMLTSGAPFAHTGGTYVGGVVAGQFTGGGPLEVDGRVEASDSVFGSLSGLGQLFLVSGTITVGADGTSTTFSGQLAGSGDLVKVGTGRLTLAGNAYHQGNTTIAAGTLRMGDGLASPSMIAGALANHGTLELFPASEVTLAQGLTGSGSLVVGSGNVRSNSPVTAPGGIEVLPGGNLFPWMLEGGTVRIDAGGQISTPEAVFGSVAGAGALLSGEVTVGSDGTSTTFTGPVQGNHWTKVGTGRLTLDGPTVQIPSIAVQGGTLRLGDGGGTTVVAGSVQNDGILELNAPGATVASLAGSGSLRVLGGTTTVLATFSLPGGIFVGGGVLAGSFAASSPLAIAAGARVDAGSAILSALSGAGTMNVAGDSAIGWGGASSSFSGTIGGNGSVSKAGAGTVTLSGPVGTEGGLYLVEGTLILHGPVAGPLASFSGAVLVPAQGPIDLATGSLSLASNTVFDILGPSPGIQHDRIVVTGTVSLAGASLTLQGAYVPIAGNAFTLIANDGVDAVTGTFAGLPEGATRVFNGTTLRISYAGGDGNDVVLAAIPTATTFEWSGAGGNPNWSTHANWMEAFTPTSAVDTVVTFGAAGTTFAPLADAPWTINRMEVSGAVPYQLAGAAITFAGAAPQLNLSGAAHGIANPLVLPATLAVASAGSGTLHGVISGPGGLLKSGPGRLTLTGASTFSGGIVVGAGAVVVAGSVPGPVAVNASASLRGTGTIGGAVDITSGGTLAPGLSPGTLDTGNLVLAGTMEVEIEGTAPGSQYDMTNVTGGVSLSGGTLQLLGAYVPVAGDTFTIIANDGADPVAGTFAGLPEGAAVAFNGASLRITYSGGTGNDVVLVAVAAAAAAGPVAVPTLSEWAVLLLASLVAGAGAISAARRGTAPRTKNPIGSTAP